MEFTFFSALSQANEETSLRTLLQLCDREFIPPLSGRSSTTQGELPSDATGDVEPYLQGVLEQPGILVRENGHAAAFLSYRENYTCDYISSDTIPNCYISTIIVHPSFRGRGIMGQLYDTMIAAFPSHSLFTRTWSTHTVHDHILRRRGFRELARIPHHRGPGIDTVYYSHIPLK